MKKKRLLREVTRGRGSPSQLQLESLMASSRCVIREGTLTVPPHYTLLGMPDLEPMYKANRLLEASLENIDRHLKGQRCCASQGSSEIVDACLYNFLSISEEEVIIQAGQLVHLYEHLLLHPLTRFRRIKNRPLQARTSGLVIFFDNTFTLEADVVCQVVWELLINAMNGIRYPDTCEVDRIINGDLLLRDLMPSAPTAS